MLCYSVQFRDNRTLSEDNDATSVTDVKANSILCCDTIEFLSLSLSLSFILFKLPKLSIHYKRMWNRFANCKITLRVALKLNKQQQKQNIDRNHSSGKHQSNSFQGLFQMPQRISRGLFHFLCDRRKPACLTAKHSFKSWNKNCIMFNCILPRRNITLADVSN